MESAIAHTREREHPHAHSGTIGAIDNVRFASHWNPLRIPSIHSVRESSITMLVIRHPPLQT